MTLTSIAAMAGGLPLLANTLHRPCHSRHRNTIRTGPPGNIPVA